MHFPYTKQSGVSALELIVVVAVIGLLIAVVVIPLSSFRQQQALQNSTNAVVAVLQDARTKTLAAVGNTAYGVRIESDRIILFTGTTYSSGASTNEAVSLETPVSAAWSLGGGSTILFARLTGTASASGTITLSLPDGTSRIVTVTSSGTITRN
ncbi:MAG: type II secretion system protein [Candidatus Pacebacteria bacterium]|nr:type II secretion system protein [Candidatus Paceibacterota bacterium]MBP9700928.1 type II secretion system protein [Candidatus Paceibacterota bacterium]